MAREKMTIDDIFFERARDHAGRVQPWADIKKAYLEGLAGLAPGTRIAALGGDPGDKKASEHRAAFARVEATIVGPKTWSKGPIRLAPRLRDVRCMWARPLQWRTGEAARVIAQEAPSTVAMVVEDQYWPFGRQADEDADAEEAAERGYDGGGRFWSLKGLCHCAGVAAGAYQVAHPAGTVAIAAAASWKSLVGRGNGQAASRDGSLALMRTMGGPAKGTKGVAGHDLAAAFTLALLGLGLTTLDQIERA